MATITAPLGGSRGRVLNAPPRPRISDYLRWSVDHKIIGVQYMATALFFFIIGGALAMLIRTELLTPSLDTHVERQRL